MSRRTFTNENFIEAIKTSISIAEILRKINLRPKGSNYSTVKNLAKELKIDISHLLGKAHLRGQIRNMKPKIPTEKLLVKGKYRGSHSIKKRILKENLLENICHLCNISEWMDKPLSLHLDHINGDPSDNRLCNLRLLCPNCHSQTATYCGKNNYKLPKKKCLGCNIRINRHSLRCKKCENASRTSRTGIRSKIEWPTTAKLITMLKTTSYSALGRKLGISDNAIRKRIEKHPNS